MKVINLFGGPGVGKSTLAADLFARFKREGVRTEWSREPAKDLLYQGRKLEEVHLTLTALQYQSLVDLKLAGTDVAICDGPLLMDNIYARKTNLPVSYYDFLRELHDSFDNINVWVDRNVPFDTHGRIQTSLAEAELLDKQIEQIANPTLYFAPNFNSVVTLFEELLRKVKPNDPV